MCSDRGDWTCLQPGFPIRKSTDHSLVIDSPWLIAASHVLHRFLVPRHPPCALKNLATDARVHCAVLKQQPTTHHPAPKHEFTGAGIHEDEPHGRTLRHPTARPTPRE